MKGPLPQWERDQPLPVEHLILETTTSARLNYENATRCFEITLDESEEQTQKIHQLQRDCRTLERFRSQAFIELLKKRHHDAQRILEKVKVVIPYVHRLRFPSRWLRTRRDHERFLCLIEVIAFLHQHQREKGVTTDVTGEGVPYVEASFEDYCLAYELAQEVLKASFHELSRTARNLWDALQSCLVKEELSDQVSFTRREIRAFTGWPDRRLREALSELVDMEYLSGEGSQGKAFHYSFLSDPTQTQSSSILGLTRPEDLKSELSQ